MPEYLYFCPTKGCKIKIEVKHSMTMCDTPTENLIMFTTCPKHHVRMQRQIFEPVLQGSVGGTFPKEGDLLAQKQKQRQYRSKAQFVHDEMNKVKDPISRAHFRKKYKGKKFKDHEKM